MQCYSASGGMPLGVLASNNNPSFERKCISAQLWVLATAIGLAGRLPVSVQQMHLNTLICVNLLDNMSTCRIVISSYICHQITVYHTYTHAVRLAIRKDLYTSLKKLQTIANKHDHKASVFIYN